MYIHLVFLLFVFLHVRCIPQTEFVTTVLSKCVCVILFTPFLSMDRLPIILAPVFLGLYLAESSSNQSIKLKSVLKKVWCGFPLPTFTLIM